MSFSQTTRTPEEHNALRDIIKSQVRCFKCTTDVQRYEELRNLKDYLHYRIAYTAYEDRLASAILTVDEQRRSYVDAELLKFDIAERREREAEKWQWSPLFQIFRKWPLPNFSAAPWEHTEAEWVEMTAVLLENVKSDPLSLETECPHILRALLSLVRTLEGYNRPLVHPSKGLHLQYILDIARSKDYSVALSQIVQCLPQTGWLEFPGIYDALDTFSELHADTAALLGYDHSNQIAVVKKIEAFVGRMAHRTVANMVRLHREEQLAQMWYKADATEQEKEKCEEVSIAISMFYS